LAPIIISVIVIAVLVVAVVVLLALRTQPQRTAGALPYERRRYLLSAAERSLFGVLEQATQGEYHIFAKVRVADLLSVQKGAAERQGHMNRITAKHVDFLLCDRAAVAPVLAIELDDSSHDAADRQKRDVFLDDAFAAAGLPLLHVRANRSYDVADLTRQIAERIRGRTASPV
jgi:hypothetical protein